MQPNLTPKTTRESRTNKTQSQQKERNHRNQSRTNEIEMKKTIAKVNDAKRLFFEKINKIDNHLARLTKKKNQRLKSKKLEMKEEKLQQTLQKYRTAKEHKRLLQATIHQ